MVLESTDLNSKKKSPKNFSKEKALKIKQEINKTRKKLKRKNRRKKHQNKEKKILNSYSSFKIALAFKYSMHT